MIKSFPISELEKRLAITKDEPLRLKLLCCIQIAKGETVRKVATIFHVSPSAVSLWFKKVNTEGVDSLIRQNNAKRPLKISDEQLDLLVDMVKKQSPELYGYNTATWTAVIIIDWILKTWEIEIKSESTIYNWLKKRTFTHESSSAI